MPTSNADDKATINDYFGSRLNITFYDDADFPEIQVDDGMTAIVISGVKLTEKLKDKYATKLGEVSFNKGPLICQNGNAWNAIDDFTNNHFAKLDVTIS